MIRQRNIDTEPQRKANKAQIKALQNKLSELDRLIQSLYEEKVLSGVSEKVYRDLMAKYERESALIQYLRSISDRKGELMKAPVIPKWYNRRFAILLLFRSCATGPISDP